MKWFEGTIPAAIQKSKESRTIFIVYISGQDEASKSMDESWNDSEVTGLCQQHGCVALRLQANSDSCAQFSMIYPVLCVPSTFFIGENGVPLEVTGGQVAPPDLIQKIHSVLQLHKDQLHGEASAGNTNQVAASAGVMETGQTEAVAGSSSPSKPLDERIEIAKSLVKDKQDEKLMQQKEEVKQEEVDRRKQGQSVNKLKQWQKEEKQKHEMDEWKKERDEQRLDKERVRRELARDREEKKTKFAEEKAERERAKTDAKQARTDTENAAKAQSDAAKMEQSRIQFRLPDGSTIVHQFSSSDMLETASQFINESIGQRFGALQLTTTFPRRHFTEEHMSMSLLDLELAPSAVIVVIPRASVARQASGSGGLLMTVMAPFLAIWNFIYGMIFAAPATPRGAHNQQEQHTPDTDTSSQTTTGRQRPKSSYGLRRRQEGNIMRLSALTDDDDDEGNTYNGNSTQQM